jgi:hypothetical protein
VVVVTLATFSVERRLKQALFDMGCSASQFAVISGLISQQRLSQALSGLKPLENRHGIALEACVKEIQELVQSTLPLSIDFRNVTGVKQALETRRLAKKEQVAELAQK